MKFSKSKNSSATPHNTLRKQLGITVALLTGMGVLWMFGKYEDRKLQRAFDGIRGQ